MPSINYQGGDEIVLNNYYNGIMNSLYREQERSMQIEQAEQKRGQAMAEKAQAQLAKINPQGLRGADLDKFNELYGQVKDNYYDVISSDNNADRLKALGKMQESISNVGLLVGQSKGKATELSKVLDDISKYPEKYSDEVVDYVDRLNKLPSDQIPADALDRSKVSRKIDTSKVPQEISKIIDDLFKSQSELQGTSAIRAQGGSFLQTIEGVDSEAFATQLLQRKADPRYQAWMEEQFPDATYEEGVQLLTDQYNEQKQFTRQERGPFVRDRAPRASSGSSGSAVQDSGQAVYNTTQAFGPDQVFESPVYLPVKADNVSLTNTKVIDLTTGRPYVGKGDKEVPLSGKIDATGLAKVPVARRDMQGIPKGSVLTPDFVRNNPDAVDYKDFYVGNLETTNALGNKSVLPVLVPKDRFPTTTKQIKNDKALFEEASKSAPQPQQTLSAQELIQKYSR